MSQSLSIQTPTALAPAQVLRVYGMRRSGNHAVIDWMMRNAPAGTGLFMNNCKPNRDPLKTARGVATYQDGRELNLDTEADKLRAAGPTPFTLVSYEDTMPSSKRSPLFEAPETCVIIYRSFLHWAASLLRKIQGNKGYGPLERMRVMMQAMRTYGEMLGRVREADVVAVCYDRWKEDEGYRRAALDRLDLPGRDLGLGAVQRYGGGSSFQGKSAEATALATDERAAQMAQDLEYQLVLWTAARDLGFMVRLAEVFPNDAERLSGLLDTATAKVTLP
ncbi:hypothetical protein [uncultured Tateyamaria sp.]|uniref:hypothetical protein n=1 Tax=uncultured Tateyamaria sp. TaxID=455651 RepID=UPI0026343C41|nr:hypothetical protein [uncultured Tateyamaria sp.]